MERLQSLCLVAESGGIMAAAKGDPNRQSLFSRQIKELEGALKLELLDRTTVPFRLSADGLKLEALTREYLEGMGRVLDGVAGRIPRVSIGAGESIIQWLVLPLLANSIKDGGLTLRFQNLTSRDTVDAIRSRRIEIGVVPSEDAAHDLKSERLATYGVIAVGKRGVLKKKSTIRWADLSGQVLAVPEGRGRLRRRIDALCEETPSGPKVVLECTSLPQIIEACGESEVVGLLPEVAKPAVKKAGLELCQIKELSDLKIDLTLIWHPVVISERAEVEMVVRRLRGA